MQLSAGGLTFLLQLSRNLHSGNVYLLALDKWEKVNIAGAQCSPVQIIAHFVLQRTATSTKR